MDFEGEEIEKTFVDVKPISDVLELKEQMGLSKEKYTKKQIDMIFKIAMDKVIESNSNLDVFKYIKLCSEFVLKQKDVKNRYNFEFLKELDIKAVQKKIHIKLL